MSGGRIDIPELKSYYIRHDIRCQRCNNKMLAGGQYYAGRRIWIDFTCIGCSRGVDIELIQFNAIMREFGFKPKAARYALSG
jgi:DNA-directed RNA polymerase subunit RPC12/RpoP